jgi:phosphatidylglycerophosphatase GEP4
VKYLVFDKDNTLTVPYERALHQSIEKEFLKCKAIYGAENMAILSNSVGSKEDKGFKEAEKVEKEIGIAVIRHEKKKPEVREDIFRHFNIDEK